VRQFILYTNGCHWKVMILLPLNLDVDVGSSLSSFYFVWNKENDDARHEQHT
jgi:hypothetical protein